MSHQIVHFNYWSKILILFIVRVYPGEYEMYVWQGNKTGWEGLRHLRFELWLVNNYFIFS